MSPALIDRVKACLQNLVATVEMSDTSSGCCCCGDDMERHSNPMYCGHSPVDQGDYIASKNIEEARALIAEIERGEL